MGPKLKGPQARMGYKVQGSTGQRGPKLNQGSTTGQIRSVQSSRARGPNGPIDPKLNQGNLRPRASWLQNARAQESAGPLGPTGPHHHANLFFHSRFFSSRLRCSSSHHRFVGVRSSCFAARRPLALGMADLMWFDLGRPIHAPPCLPGPRFTPKWRFSRVQSDSNLLLFGDPSSVGNRSPCGRWHSEPPGFARRGCVARRMRRRERVARRMLGPRPPVPVMPYGSTTAAQPPVKAPPCSHPPNAPLAVAGWRPMMATLGFLRLPVFNAFSGNHMELRGRTAYVNVCILTHTVGDVVLVLRNMFSNPLLTMVRPIPEDPSLPIRAVTNGRRQGLSIYLPLLPQVASEASAPEASLPRKVPPWIWVPQARTRLSPQPYHDDE
jgi:hypothetical protein